MARFLTEHGACIFAATSLEKKTPMQCCERGVPDYFSCMKYLNGESFSYFGMFIIIIIIIIFFVRCFIICFWTECFNNQNHGKELSPHRRNRDQSFSEGVKLSFILFLFTCVYEKALELVPRDLCNFLGNIQIRVFFFRLLSKVNVVWGLLQLCLTKIYNWFRKLVLHSLPTS